jgi:hypothetical protein
MEMELFSSLLRGHAKVGDSNERSGKCPRFLP